MSLGSDAIRTLKDIILNRERFEQIGVKLDGLATDIEALTKAVVEVDRRVARIEGFIEGAAASGTRRARLPKA